MRNDGSFSMCVRLTYLFEARKRGGAAAVRVALEPQRGVADQKSFHGGAFFEQKLVRDAHHVRWPNRLFWSKKCGTEKHPAENKMKKKKKKKREKEEEKRRNDCVEVIFLLFFLASLGGLRPRAHPGFITVNSQ